MLEPQVEEQDGISALSLGLINQLSPTADLLLQSKWTQEKEMYMHVQVL